MYSCGRVKASTNPTYEAKIAVQKKRKNVGGKLCIKVWQKHQRHISNFKKILPEGDLLEAELGTCGHLKKDDL